MIGPYATIVRIETVGRKCRSTCLGLVSLTVFRKTIGSTELPRSKTLASHLLIDPDVILLTLPLTMQKLACIMC